jgi:hypothetical protein
MLLAFLCLYLVIGLYFHPYEVNTFVAARIALHVLWLPVVLFLAVLLLFSKDSIL